MLRIDIQDDVLKALFQGRASGLSYAKLAKKYGYKVDTVTRAIKECGLSSEAVRRVEKATLKLPTYWREPLKVTRSKVLILQGPRSSLSVRRRQLVVFDAGREILYMPGIPPFESVLVEAPGFQITGEALKWLSRHDVGLFVMTGNNAALAMLTTPPAKRAKLRLAQYAAFCNPLPLASAIVAQKINASHEYGVLDKRQTRAFTTSVQEAADLRSLLLIEAAAAQAHF